MYIRIRKPNLNPSLMLISSAPLTAARRSSALRASARQLASEHRTSGPEQLPVFAYSVEESEGRTDQSVLFRSEYPILRAAYQSDGKNSIPGHICPDATFTELGTWGSCPASAETLFYRLQARFGLPVTQLVKQTDTWSDNDQEQPLQHELPGWVAAWKAQKF
ncbi:hypothetical protein GCM10011375_05130 [Hymenobacter qilianensis]|uniref:Uncharacterized protein n=1 Tax=Hymenobacter qilianensis TaxID=1385715 RepID=A0ACB5PM99_9BACT|nr:hypothetical protein GCM10011375_05130 [Hymenobacter qilianensis]